MFNKDQIALYQIYSNLDVKVQTDYTQRFMAHNRPLLLETTEVQLDHEQLTNKSAKLFKRGTSVPSITMNGYQTLAVTPPSLGASMPLDSLGGLKVGAGVPYTFVGGKFVKNTLQDETAKLAFLKKSIMIGLEDLCAEVFLTSKIASLSADFGEADSNAGNLDYDPTNEKLSVKIVRLWREFYQNKKHTPVICIGDNVLDALIKEVESSGTKNTRGDYSMKTVGEGAEKSVELTIDLLNVPFEILPYGKSFGTDVQIDTSNLIQLYSPITLIIAYAIMSTVDASGAVVPLVGEYRVGKTAPDFETAQAKIFAYSHPLPIIVEPKLIERRQLVIA